METTPSASFVNCQVKIRTTLSFIIELFIQFLLRLRSGKIAKKKRAKVIRTEEALQIIMLPILYNC